MPGIRVRRRRDGRTRTRRNDRKRRARADTEYRKNGEKKSENANVHHGVCIGAGSTHPQAPVTFNCLCAAPVGEAVANIVVAEADHNAVVL